ncbi:unnamed protein product [Leptidea sinapis]|uniref:TGF-beta propeptide domain-containing protein n=1 Tax=Leptidea sinapis TaxID=189913 RepID=A0A5E4PTZ6_9NEOP|nr:unnamed protein product [Leptidea sinapis]
MLPLLLLTIAALSSTNELPLIEDQDLDDLISDQIKNTLNNRLPDKNKQRDILLSKIYRKLNLKPILSNGYGVHSSGDDIFNEQLSKEYIADDDGIKNDQGREYPTLLDGFGVGLETNPTSITKLIHIPQKDDINDEDKLIELLLNSNDEIVTISPLLILKIRLSYLNNGLRMPGQGNNGQTNEISTDSESGRLYNKILESGNNVVDGDNQSLDLPTETSKKLVKKRIFSLWSRIQGLHRGHELHHRRHLHAFYGIPDDGGGGSSKSGTLTAETRATFIRPPGSPLRWG